MNKKSRFLTTAAYLSGPKCGDKVKIVRADRKIDISRELVGQIMTVEKPLTFNKYYKRDMFLTCEGLWLTLGIVEFV